MRAGMSGVDIEEFAFGTSPRAPRGEREIEHHAVRRASISISQVDRVQMRERVSRSHLMMIAAARQICSQ
jgi:hypothetical protein